MKYTGSVLKNVLPYRKTIFVLLALLVISCKLSANDRTRYVYKGKVEHEVLYRIEGNYIYKGKVEHEVLYRIE
jgi:hypothetical protein